MQTRDRLLDEKRQLASKLASGISGNVYKATLRHYYEILDDLKNHRHKPVVKK